MYTINNEGVARQKVIFVVFYGQILDSFVNKLLYRIERFFSAAYFCDMHLFLGERIAVQTKERTDRRFGFTLQIPFSAEFMPL